MGGLSVLSRCSDAIVLAMCARVFAPPLRALLGCSAGGAWHRRCAACGLQPCGGPEHSSHRLPSVCVCVLCAFSLLGLFCNPHHVFGEVEGHVGVPFCCRETACFAVVLFGMFRIYKSHH